VEIVYFTLVAALLYLLSNWLVERLEIAAGRRFEYRSLLFFVILLTLAMISFYLIRLYTGNP
jgi:amino acid permease